jgi:hypothetical protein
MNIVLKNNPMNHQSKTLFDALEKLITSSKDVIKFSISDIDNGGIGKDKFIEMSNSCFNLLGFGSEIKITLNNNIGLELFIKCLDWKYELQLSVYNNGYWKLYSNQISFKNKSFDSVRDMIINELKGFVE